MNTHLSGHNWYAITQEVLKYVLARLFIADPVQKGDKAREIAEDAIERWLDGRRNWNQEKEPDLANYLKSVACSIISEKFGRRAKPTEQPELPSRLENVDKLETPVGKENLLQLNGKPLNADKWNQMVNECIKGDEEVELVALLLQEGKKPRNIAAELLLDVRKVYQLIKKLKTCLMSKVSVIR